MMMEVFHMEQRVVDFAPSNMNGETTDLENRETQELSDPQRLRASYDNDLFLRDQESFEIEKRNTVRESKAKIVGTVALKVGGALLLGGGGIALGSHGVSVLVKTIRGDDDDN